MKSCKNVRQEDKNSVSRNSNKIKINDNDAKGILDSQLIEIFGKPIDEDLNMRIPHESSGTHRDVPFFLNNASQLDSGCRKQ